MGIRSDHVERYMSGLRPERPALVREMEELADRDHVPIVEWETARFLATLTRALRPQRVLEVGTAIGYSTLHIAEQLPESGRILTLERDPRRIEQASDFLARGGVRERVEIVEGDALDTLPGLDGPFDLIFLDATKGEYRRYLEIAEAKASERAVLILDNLLMQGEVARPEGQARGWSPDSIASAQAMNAELVSSERWLGSVLPVGDGLGFAVRT
jgi:predicted O-methyltransferase YrrM